MGADVSQLNRLAVDLGRAGAAVVPLASTVIARTAHDIEGTAKALCPVDTGNLRGSISTTAAGLTAEVGPTASYGGYVEFGTSRMAPRAYLGPAFDRHAWQLPAALAQAGVQAAARTRP